MSGQDLYSTMAFWLNELDEAIQDFKTYGLQMAEHERDYRQKAATLTAKLKADGTPVTIIDSLVKGDKAVSEARCRRTASEINKDTARERVNSAKVHIRILSEQIDREYKG